jgi:REP element-mobilizing transposase RayT
VFTTWTTYGTWLPGDARGWYRPGYGSQAADPIRETTNALWMSEDAITLADAQRALVEATITDHCRFRGWLLHAVNCRTNHVHVVVSAAEAEIHVPRGQFKAWCTRKLRAASEALLPTTTARNNWWTDRGWDEYIDDEDSLAAVIEYVRDRQ